MRIPVMLAFVIGIGMPLYAQPPSASERTHFIEGAFSATYTDTLGLALEDVGGGAEVGFEVWRGKGDAALTKAGSVRFRIERLGASYLTSFLVAREWRDTRIGLEVPFGIAVMTEPSQSAFQSSQSGFGATLSVGFPLAIGSTDRITVVPRLTALLLFEGGLAGLMPVAGVGLRCQF